MEGMEYCDICGREEDRLATLPGCYPTESIKRICQKCIDRIDTQLREFERMSNKRNGVLLQRFMENLKHKMKK